MKLIPRTTRPEKGNKYYITRKNGGWSWAIEGKDRGTGKPDPDCDVLSNCVGYVAGRFNEEANYGKIKYNIVCNAEDFIDRSKRFGLESGLEPKVGGIMVWRKGKTHDSKDGAGHVEIIEQKFADGHIKCSASGYNAFVWRTYDRTNEDGNWRKGCPWMGEDYVYLGCIYNPDIDDEITGDKPEGVIDLKLLVDGREQHIWATVIGQQNYVRLAELPSIGLAKSVTYDASKGIPVVESND